MAPLPPPPLYTGLTRCLQRLMLKLCGIPASSGFSKFTLMDDVSAVNNVAAALSRSQSHRSEPGYSDTRLGYCESCGALSAVGDEGRRGLASFRRRRQRSQQRSLYGFLVTLHSDNGSASSLFQKIRDRA